MKFLMMVTFVDSQPPLVPSSFLLKIKIAKSKKTKEKTTPKVKESFSKQENFHRKSQKKNQNNRSKTQNTLCIQLVVSKHPSSQILCFVATPFQENQNITYLFENKQPYHHTSSSDSYFRRGPSS
mmetsp:Transcript_7579/g.13503  ORF Transcript_7579/g.13503 Transcript_7579/m.13503 type:complete len:125 (-) Transcript_7579:129-503(-)